MSSWPFWSANAPSASTQAAPPGIDRAETADGNAPGRPGKKLDEEKKLVEQIQKIRSQLEPPPKDKDRAAARCPQARRGNQLREDLPAAKDLHGIQGRQSPRAAVVDASHREFVSGWTGIPSARWS